MLVAHGRTRSIRKSRLESGLSYADPESVTPEPLNYRKTVQLKALSTPSAVIHFTPLELVKNNDVTDGSGVHPVLVAFSTGPPDSA